MVKFTPNDPAPPIPQKGARYPFVTRILIDLLLSGELPTVREVDIEPEFGYVGRIVYHSGAVGMFRAANLHLNSLGASEIAKDKGYTKYFLQQLGYQTPTGKVFILPNTVATGSTQNYQAFAAEVDSYITQHIGYPCFLKPNAQSQGVGVHKCLDREDIAFVLQENQRNRLLDNPHHSLQLFLVEKAISWPDYRVVVFNNQVVACYRRSPLSVVGDGTSTVQELLQQKQAQFAQHGRSRLLDIHDPRIIRRLQKMQIDIQTILPAGEVYYLHDISNLCAGGEVEDYTERICDFWRSFCIQLVAAMGLRLCGVDLACADIEQPDSAYSILELNSVPGLSNYASIGEQQACRVRALYQQIFSEDRF